MAEIQEIAEDIWSRLEGNIEALYLAGSRAVDAEEMHSDFDFFGIVDEEYNFDEERSLNKELSEKYGEVIRFRGLSLKELNGGGQRGIITNYVPMSVVIKPFPNWEHLKGKKYSLEDFDVEAASPKEEAQFYVKTLREKREKAEEEELPMPFEDYVKNVLRLMGAEEQLQGKDFTQDFEKIVKRAPEHAEELAQICLNFRKTGEMDRERFFGKLDEYLQTFKSKHSI